MVKSFYKIKPSSSNKLEVPTVNAMRLTSKKKRRNFIHNGALLLEMQIASSKGKDNEPIKIYSEEEICYATNGYDPALIIGHNLATVYRGNLEDRVVALKTPQGLDGSDEQIDFFLNQVTIKQQISHKNVVKLYGCCLETHIPILVHEFMPFTLSDLLHQPSDCWISWQSRLRIATETAYALSYMHSAGPKPIVHRNVKPSSIFLDKSHSAKLSNFGFSIAINPEEMKPIWPPLGTKEYIDPEYLQTSVITQKCDVYSFGVVMVELLTGKRPRDMWNQGADIVKYFPFYMMRNCLLYIVDQRLLQEGTLKGTSQQFAELAMGCIQSQGVKRPTMEEIVSRLRQMQKCFVSGVGS